MDILLLCIFDVYSCVCGLTMARRKESSIRILWFPFPVWCLRYDVSTQNVSDFIWYSCSAFLWTVLVSA